MSFKGENFLCEIYWTMDQIWCAESPFSVEFNKYDITDNMKKDIEIALREELPRKSFYKNLYNNINIDFCFVHSQYESIIRNRLVNEPFRIQIQVNDTCYCWKYSLPEITYEVETMMSFK